MYTQGKPQFSYTKVGCMGVFIIRTCFPDDKHQQVVPYAFYQTSLVMRK